MWYVHVMLAEMVILVILRRLIRSDRAFTLTIAGIMTLALILKFSGLMYSWGFVRGASSIPMGLLLAKLPRLKPKRKWLLWLPLVPVMACCFAMVRFHLGNLEWWGIRIPELLLDNLLYPALIYLSFCLGIRNRVFSYLGALSFGLYALECPADLLRKLVVVDMRLLFVLILAATLLEDGTKRLHRLRVTRRSASDNVGPALQ